MLFERISVVNFLFACLAVGTIYITVDGLRRLGVLKGEYARKSIHITLGVFLASLPLFMSRTEIAVFNSAFFLGLVTLSYLSNYLARNNLLQSNRLVVSLTNAMKAYESVNRWTIGQFLYPLSLLLVTFMFDDLRLYSLAVLQLAFADGFAAVVGKWNGRRRYYTLGGYKTVLGSATFFIASYSIFIFFVVGTVGFTSYSLALSLAGAIVLTFVEGLIAGGFDNLAVPIVAALIGQSLL